MGEKGERWSLGHAMPQKVQCAVGPRAGRSSEGGGMSAGAESMWRTAAQEGELEGANWGSSTRRGAGRGRQAGEAHEIDVEIEGLNMEVEMLTLEVEMLNQRLDMGESGRGAGRLPLQDIHNLKVEYAVAAAKLQAKVAKMLQVVGDDGDEFEEQDKKTWEDMKDMKDMHDDKDSSSEPPSFSSSSSSLPSFPLLHLLLGLIAMTAVCNCLLHLIVRGYRRMLRRALDLLAPSP